MELLRSKHVKYFQRSLQLLPTACGEIFDRKPMVAFFAVCGLDVLDELPEDRTDLIEWFYSLQHVDEENQTAGFLGGFKVADENEKLASFYDLPGIGMTYTSLVCLLTLGDDLSRVRREEILNEVKRLQQKDGSFASHFRDGEFDLRFVYCAICVCYLLDDFTKIDFENCLSYIMSCLCYDGAFACVPGAEAHGGSTFCAIASLFLMDKLDMLGDERRRKLVQWCLFRQETGFNGRPNKLVDTCYSFWIGATLQILDAFHLTNRKANRDYILSTQCPITGGMGKWDGHRSDLLHTHLGLSGLSFIGRDNLKQIFAPLNITMKAHDRLTLLHASTQKRSNLK